eukprot:jgi/Orpsp1_1/1176908/evm.model.c7180000059457.1
MNSYLFFVTVTASLVGLLIGYQTGAFNIVLIMDAFRIFFKAYHWNGDVTDENGGYSTEISNNNEMMYRKLNIDTNKTNIENIISISATFGSFIAVCMTSLFGNKFGRQKSIMICIMIYICGALIEGLSPRYLQIFSIGRFITGFSLGIGSTLTPIYIAEISPAKIRGKLCSYYVLIASFGSFLGTVVTSITWYFTNVKPANLGIPRKDPYESINNFEWRFSFLIRIVPALIAAICVKFLPKSPRWLCLKNRDDEAAEVLSKLRGEPIYDASVQTELRAIQEDVATTTIRSTNLFGSVLRRRTFITILMQLFNSFSGLNIVMYMITFIFIEIGYTRFTSVVTYPVSMGVVGIISILPGIWTVDRFGRKNLLAIGSILMMIFELSTLFLYSKASDGVMYYYYAFGSALLCIMTHSSTWGLVPSIYQAEVFPIRVRIKGSIVGIISSYVFNYIISILGSSLLKMFRINAILIYCVVFIIAFLFSKFYIIESKSYMLEEMDERMSGKDYDYEKIENTV